MIRTQSTIHELEAFCSTCPAPEDVMQVLHALGLELTFQMNAVTYPAYSQTPPLAAQFHFRDRHGNELIYLAGHDVDTDGVRLPPHASRYWAYPGADAGVYRWITHAMATRWAFIWQHPPTAHAHQEVA